MWSFDLPHRAAITAAAVAAAMVVLAVFLAGCTVQPLNAARTNAPLLADGVSPSVQSTLAAMSVQPVNDRVAQQVRNTLLFELNGGKMQPGGRYEVRMVVVTSERSLAVESDSLSPTAAQTAVTVDYQVIEKSTGKPVAGGKRRAVASYDKTPQSFANERAERDAQNRAAKEVARHLRLAIAQSLATL